MNTDELFALNPEDRARVLSSTKPPIAHTHRKPVIITAQMIFERRARLAARTTPNTHRGEPRPILDELSTVNGLLAATGKDPHRA